MKNELIFLSGQFFDCDLPKEKQYLFRYFDTDLERQFLRYYHCFGQYDYFTDHTGMRCQVRWLRILKKRLDLLVRVHAQAKMEMELELLAQIETGKYCLNRPPATSIA